jgi:hypothetical protein
MESTDATTLSPPSPDLLVVMRDGCALKYIENQTPEICLAAVNNTGYALKYVQNQTLEICLAAIKEDRCAFKYVENPTPEIYLAVGKSLLKNGKINFIWKQSKKIIFLKAIKEANDDFYQDLIAKVFHPDRCERMIASYGEIWADTFF